MTVSKLIILTAIAIGLITLLKFVFVTLFDIGNLYITYFLWFLIAAITVACCRRLGVLNYLEALTVLIIWIFLAMFIDAMFLTSVTGFDAYRHLYLWVSYIVIGVTVFAAHKKRHVEIRRARR